MRIRLPAHPSSRALGLALACALWAAAGSCRDAPPPVELRRYALDDLSGLITQDGVEVDPSVSDDGRGSLRIDGSETRTVRLFETGDVDVEAARLTYRARIRTLDVRGRVYLEMWCVFDGQGEYFSRALDTAVTGTQAWSTQETPFFLQRGQNPSNVKLNLVIEGGGTVWIDDVRLLQSPLG